MSIILPLLLTVLVAAASSSSSSWPDADYLNRLEHDKAKMKPTVGRMNGTNATGSGRCKGNALYVSCEYQQTHVEGRWVGWQVPEGDAPEGGWPFVVIYHGWGLMNSEYCWYAEDWYYYGLFFKAQTVQKFLENGFGVVTPDSDEQTTYWETNQPPYNNSDMEVWKKSKDNVEVDWIFQQCEAGFFGPCNSKKIHSIGFSSGAYMSGRMPVSYTGKFQTLTVLSGSFYYCYGAECNTQIASQLPSSAWSPPNHPRTLFTHGTSDPLVPYWSSALYNDYIKNHSVVTIRKSFEGMGHQWPPTSADDIYSWIVHGNVTK